MIYKLRHIFVFIFVFSVFSLTLQATIVNLCKDNKVFKSQNQTNPVSEEEEESHDTDEDADEMIYIEHHHYEINPISINKLFWFKSEIEYLSFTKSIPIPPPKF